MTCASAENATDSDEMWRTTPSCAASELWPPSHMQRSADQAKRKCLGYATTERTGGGRGTEGPWFAHSITPSPTQSVTLSVSRGCGEGGTSGRSWTFPGRGTAKAAAEPWKPSAAPIMTFKKRAQVLAAPLQFQKQEHRCLQPQRSCMHQSMDAGEQWHTTASRSRGSRSRVQITPSGYSTFGTHTRARTHTHTHTHTHTNT